MADMNPAAPDPAAPADAPTASGAAAETDAQEKSERLEQTVAVEDIGPARKCLTIEIPPQRIAKKLEENLGKLKDEAAIPGFRRGRAPRRLIEKRFGTSVRDDVRGQLISESYQQAIDQEKLEVLGEPEVKDLEKITLPESGALTVKVEVEVVPTFDLPDFAGIEVTKPTVAVTDEQVQAEISQLRRRFGRLTPAPAEAAASSGDWLLADVRILAGENAGQGAQEILHHPGAYVLVTGEDQAFKGQVAGIAVDDLGRRLAGGTAGQTVTISMTGPAGHEEEKIKGQPITIVLRIDRIDRMEEASAESLIQQLGLENAEGLRERVRQMLQARQERAQRLAMHEQVCDHLLKKVPMDLPANLSKRQTARLLHRRALDMAMKGVPEPEIQQKLAELRQGSEQEAARQLKLFFILDRASKHLKVEVAEAEVNGMITMLAMQRGRRPEKLRQEMQRSGQIEQVYLEVRDSKTLDKILEQARVVESGEPVKTD